jgi:chromosomal replication initiator protein DnaA
MLLDEGLIEIAHLDQALAKQQEEGGFIGEILVRLGFVTQDAVVSCLVKQCKIPHLNLLDYEVTKEVLKIIPKEMCIKHNLLPIDKLGRILTIAMVNPFDTEALEEVRRTCPELRIKPILCDWEHLRTVLGRVFGEENKRPGSGVDAHAFRLPSAKPAPKPDAVSAAETKVAIDAAVNSILEEAEYHPKPAPGPQRTSGEASHAKTAVSEQHLSALVRESVGGAIQEAMATLMVQSRAEGAHRKTLFPAAEGEEPADAAGPTAAEPPGAVSAEMNKPAPKQAFVPVCSADEIAEAIRDSVGGAMQEALAQIIAQARTTAVQGTPQLDEMVRSTVRELVRDGEEAAVARMNQRDLAARDAERLKREKHSSVSSFDSTGRRPTSPSGHPEGRLESDERVLAAMRSDRLLEGYTFDSFCVGKGNTFTFKLCQAVSETPGAQYNPFFIYGDVGLGKTHLINAVGNAILGCNPDQRVGYVSSSRFASRLADAARDAALDAFRANYCHWDVLILDDIQFLAGRVEAQEEFFHIFNVLQQEGRQVIIAGDKQPDRLGLLEQRLVSRFAGGIVVNLKPPEWETRMTILRRRVAEDGVEVDEEITSLIAMRVPNDVRKMIGALKKIIAYAQLVGEPISSEMANEILCHLGVEEAA